MSADNHGTTQPRYIRVHSNDNVAIIVNSGGVREGAVFPCGLRLKGDIPQGHKVAISDLARNEAIVRYGEVIGHAAEFIAEESRVDEAMIRMPTPPRLEELSIATRVPAPQPPLDGFTFEGYLLQLASGMNMHVFTTGRGTPYGLAMAPVLKVSTRTALAEQWADLIDIDAGRIATGNATIEEVGWEIFRMILDVASGRRQTWAERWGLHNDLCLFNPGPLT